MAILGSYVLFYIVDVEVKWNRFVEKGSASVVGWIENIHGLQCGYGRGRLSRIENWNTL